MPRGRRLQILPQATQARNIPLIHGLFRRQCPLRVLVMNHTTTRHMKNLGIRRNHHQHIGRNPPSRLRVLRFQFRSRRQRIRHSQSPCKQRQRRDRNQPRRQATTTATAPLTRAVCARRLSSRRPNPAGTAIANSSIMRSSEYNAITLRVPSSTDAAVLAREKMLVHRRAQAPVDVAFNVVRNLAPHPFAVQRDSLFTMVCFPSRTAAG